MDHSPQKLANHADTHGGHGHDAHHEELPWWRKYIFSSDHKVIGIQYLLCGLVFLFFGFLLVMAMRWSIAYPDTPLGVVVDSARQPVGGVNIGLWFEKFFNATTPGGEARSPLGTEILPGGVIQPDFYNSLGAMHGTIMIFLGIVPIAFAAFGNYVVPLQIGAPDMTFPRVNMASFWSFFIGGAIMLFSFSLPTGAAKGGWTSYTPLATIVDQAPNMWLTGQTWWLLGFIFLITSSLLGAVNFIATIIQLRAPGLTWFRLPFFVWAQLITAFLLLLAFPPLEAAVVMQLMDRVAGTSFFSPEGLVVSGQVWNQISGGGSPLLWQHLFWFLGHPEVYVLILPGLGMVAEILANNTRKPLWSYKGLVFATLTIGFLSFIVWAHHMYLTGMGTKVSAFFQTTTIIISVPSVIIVTALLITLWGGSIRFTVPMLFATAFLPMFGIGGLTGIPLAFNSVVLYLHDTYYVIAHFHYIVAPGTIFAVFAGIYYWFPKATGRHMSNFLGHLHFWPSLILMNGIFLPMFIQGMAGVHRRWVDGGASYQLAQPVLHWNAFSSWSAWLLGLAQLPFIFNFFWSIWKGRKATSDNPWHATTLEWAAPNVPPHGNFPVPVAVYRGPYEYSVPGEEQDYSPQFVAPRGGGPEGTHTRGDGVLETVAGHVPATPGSKSDESV